MTSPRVLVVDDNRDMANGIAMLLGDADLETHVAYSGRRAVRLLETGDYELVLSDIRMPAMDGLDLLKTIRARWPRTKVVLLTAYGAVDSAVEAMKNGACDYLTKPFDNDALVDVVQRVLATGAASDGFDTTAVVGEVAVALSGDDLFVSLKKALHVLLRATGADDGEIFLCEPQGEDPLLSVWAGPDGDALVERVRFTRGVGYPGIVVATGEPLCAQGELANDSRYLRRAVVDAGMRSLVAVPLPDSRGPLGSLHLMSRRDDFPTRSVCDLLQHAAMPISNAVRAYLAVLRQSVDAVCGNLDDPTGRPLRELLESMREVAGARYGTLALIDPRTGAADRIVSTSPASLVCAGSWATCPSVTAAHGVATNPGRRQWPEACRNGLPRRAASPCCLPLVANSTVQGIAVLDFGRDGTEHATGRLVPLLTMAHQIAIRLQSQRAAIPSVTEQDSGPARVAAAATPELVLRCLGPFGVHRRGQPIAAEAFTRQKALVLLKMLAIKAGAPVDREILIEQLWPEVEPQLGANRLHGVVHDLRSVIEPQRNDREWRYVRNRGDLYYLDTSAPIDLDVSTFRSMVTDGMRATDDARAIACLEHAVTLYRGDLFEDDPFAEWCEAERVELKGRQVEALTRLAQLHGKRGSREEALACLQRASRASPFRDDLMLSQLDLLAQLGRCHEARTMYDDYEDALREELDVAPSPELRAFRLRLTSSQY